MIWSTITGGSPFSDAVARRFGVEQYAVTPVSPRLGIRDAVVVAVPTVVFLIASQAATRWGKGDARGSAAACGVFFDGLARLTC
jgi:hypothetical protein